MESTNRRRGVSLAAIKQAQADRQPTSAGYQEAMLEMVERGRDDAGRVGDLSALYEQYAVHVRPVITQTSDHRWRAEYPGVDWYVVADSAESAADEVSKEALRRIEAGDSNAQPPDALLGRHLTHPIPGVYALDRELFLYLRIHAGHTETQKAFEEAERRRAAGQPYTKVEYLAENRPHDAI